MVITVHRWFANKSCHGNWLYSRLGDLASKVTAQLGSDTKPAESTKPTALAIKAGDLVKTQVQNITADRRYRLGSRLKTGMFTVFQAVVQLSTKARTARTALCSLRKCPTWRLSKLSLPKLTAFIPFLTVSLYGQLHRSILAKAIATMKLLS